MSTGGYLPEHVMAQNTSSQITAKGGIAASGLATGLTAGLAAVLGAASAAGLATASAAALSAGLAAAADPPDRGAFKG